MKNPFTIIFVFSFFLAFSQKLDYRKMRDTICPPVCGWRDSLSLSEIVPKLLAVDTNQLIGKSRRLYFHDLANSEYQYYAYTLDTVYMRSSAVHHLNAVFNDPKDFTAYWNAAFSYAFIGECDKMDYYLKLYEKHTPRKYLSDKYYEKIDYLRQSCK